MKMNGLQKIILKERLNDGENIRIHTPTLKDYDNIMQVLEAGGYKLLGNYNPTYANIWKHKKGDTCLIIENNYIYLSDVLYEKKGMGAKIYSPNEFLEAQEIDLKTQDKIHSWFEKHKPFRESKGGSH